MKKNLSYREKLLELSKIYKISEIQNYIRSKKHLTTSQIEHILKKNKVPIPTEINVSFFDKTISKPVSKASKGVSNFYGDTTDNIAKFSLGTWKFFGNAGLAFLNVIPKLFKVSANFIGNTFVDAFSSIYDPKISTKRANTLVSTIGVFIITIAIGIIAYTLYSNYKDDNFVKNKKQEIKIEKKDLKEKKKSDIPKQEKKTNIVQKPKAEPKKDPSKVKELVLPNLNLKTETVLSLFEDVEYDLRTVRYQKKVKPIYFTQFPKDLDEIKDVKLKKDTFIKIVLPLVVAENEKILNDRLKLKKILSKKMTSDKEKLWLRQKFREYKVKKLNSEELLSRMDVIPVSIALAQAAKESGWGTSRFALEGNAIFGQWTWTGQGIEPLEKGKNQDHKILKFPILRASVKAYKNNLNTHKGYIDFREKREKLRKRNKSIKGLELTDTLHRYAQTGKEYTEKLEQIIKQNDLSDFESVQLTNSVIKKEFNL
jgi:Bax protein